MNEGPRNEYSVVLPTSSLEYATGYILAQTSETPRYLYRDRQDGQKDQYVVASAGNLQENEPSFTPLVYLLPAPTSEQVIGRSIIDFAKGKFRQALLKLGDSSWRLYEKDGNGRIQVLSGDLAKQPHLRGDWVVFKPVRFLTSDTIAGEIFEVHILYALANPPTVKESPASREALIYSQKIWPTSGAKIIINPFEKKEFQKIK